VRVFLRERVRKIILINVTIINTRFFCTVVWNSKAIPNEMRGIKVILNPMLSANVEKRPSFLEYALLIKYPGRKNIYIETNARYNKLNIF
jgi:hypothetical protein